MQNNRQQIPSRPIQLWVRNHRYIIAVLGALVLAFAIYLSLPFGDATFDEVFSIRMATQPVGSLLRLLQFETNPPLYYLLLKGWLSIVGETVMAARALSLVCAVAALAGIFMLSQLLFGRKTAGYATVLFAFSPFTMFFAREARMYPLLIALFLWASFFFWKYLQSKQKKDLLWYLVLLTLAGFTHYGAWPVIAMHVCVSALLAHRRFGIAWYRFFGLHIPSAVLLISWFIVLYVHRFAPSQQSFSHWAFSFHQFRWYFLDLVETGMFTNAGQLGAFGIPFQLLFWGTVCVLIYRVIHRIMMSRVIPEARVEGAIVWLLFISVGIMGVAFVFRFEAVRFLVLSLAFIPVMLGIGIARSNMWRWAKAFAVLYLLGTCMIVMPRVTTLAEPIAWKKLVAFVEAERRPDDAVLIHVFNESLTYEWHANGATVQGLFPGKPDYSFQDVVTYNAASVVTEDTVDALAQYVSGYQRVILIDTFGDRVPNFWHGELVQSWFLSHGWQSIRTDYFGVYGQGAVRIYERNK